MSDFVWCEHCGRTFSTVKGLWVHHAALHDEHPRPEPE